MTATEQTVLARPKNPMHDRTVEATPMTHNEYVIYRGWNGGIYKDPNDKSGYRLVDTVSGSQSWSPRWTFEKYWVIVEGGDQ